MILIDFLSREARKEKLQLIQLELGRQKKVGNNEDDFFLPQCRPPPHPPSNLLHSTVLDVKHLRKICNTTLIAI